MLNSHARWNQSAGRDDGLIKIHGSDKEVRFPGPLVSVNVDVVGMYSEDKILCSHKLEVFFLSKKLQCSNTFTCAKPVGQYCDLCL